MNTLENLGYVLGVAISPLFGVAARLRGHASLSARGILTAGQATSLAPDGPVSSLAQRLEGAVLARWSGTRQADPDAPRDVLGLAIRFRDAGPFPDHAEARDQDLLTLSAPALRTLLAGDLPDAADVEAHTYAPFAPLRDQDLGPVALRLQPQPPATPRRGDTRTARLRDAVTQGDLRLHLQVRGEVTGDAWVDVVSVTLTELPDLDPGRVTFDPFRSGRGLTPDGLGHAVRLGVYRPASQPAARRSDYERQNDG